MYPRQARNILTEQIESSAITSSLLSFFFGIGIGFSISLLIAIFLLIGLHLVTDETFQKEYRLWRGIGLLILYLWVASLSSYIYNEKRFN